MKIKSRQVWTSLDKSGQVDSRNSRYSRHFKTCNENQNIPEYLEILEI